MFLLYRERNDRRLSTPARARGYSRREHITRGNTYPRVGGTHITVIHQGEQISPGAWPGICVRGNRKSGGTHISVTPAGINPLNTKLSCWNFNLVNADQFSRE